MIPNPAVLDSCHFSSSLLIIYDGKSVKKGSLFEAGDNKLKTRLYSDASISDADLDFDAYSDESVSAMELEEPQHQDLVTMKMIDFAHTTFEGFMDDPIIHDGPDLGYIKGVDTLLAILEHSLYEEAV